MHFKICKWAAHEAYLMHFKSILFDLLTSFSNKSSRWCISYCTNTQATARAILGRTTITANHFACMNAIIIESVFRLNRCVRALSNRSNYYLISLGGMQLTAHCKPFNQMHCGMSKFGWTKKTWLFEFPKIINATYYAIHFRCEDASVLISL